MHPALVIALAAAAALPLGLWLRHDLNQLGYRTAVERDLPHPGPRRWVVWTSILALGSLAAAATLSHDSMAYLPLVPLAIVGPWLAAVDLDVLRIPNPVLVPTAAITLLALVGAALAERTWSTLMLPVAAGLVTGGVFASVHFATKGGIGFGDVKLALLIGLAVGPLGVSAVWLNVLAGSVAALIWAKASREAGAIPYGPWLLLGSWLVVLSGVIASI